MPLPFLGAAAGQVLPSLMQGQGSVLDASDETMQTAGITVGGVTFGAPTPRDTTNLTILSVAAVAALAVIIVAIR